MNYSPKFWEGIDVVKMKDMCYKGLSKPERADKLFCPKYFDGTKCWKEAMVGQTVQEPCPDYVIGFDLLKSTSKTCGADGVWLDPTDYTNCFTSAEDIRMRKLGYYMYAGSYGLASSIMVIAFLIFLVFRKDIDHFSMWTQINFFFANLFKNIISMTWYINVIGDPAVVLFNPIWCQILHNFTTYSNLTSHSWLLVEALNIYNTVAIEHYRMKDSLLLFTFIGWAIPILVVAAYSTARIFFFMDTDSCWTETQPAFYIISTFNYGTLIVSLFLLVKAIYIKYQKTNCLIASMKCTKVFLILIPLIAIQDVWNMTQQRLYALDVTFLIDSAIIIMFKGMLSAFSFCCTNEEESEVEIPMTDMSGNMHRRDLPV